MRMVGPSAPLMVGPSAPSSSPHAAAGRAAITTTAKNTPIFLLIRYSPYHPLPRA